MPRHLRVLAEAVLCDEVPRETEEAVEVVETVTGTLLMLEAEVS